MPVIVNSFTDEIIRLLRGGAIGVIRTDTLYGIVGRASDEAAVRRIYDVKGRTPTKSPITLIDTPDDLFDSYDNATTRRLGELWPGKTSVILPSTHAPAWIVRGNASVAYRIPDDEKLRQLLRQTGPLAAPSANPEGEAPAMTVDEAKVYFGDTVDFYVDGGTVTDDSPSKLYRLQPDGLERLR
jgi:L-threonylcarbamoyladenylate synthase